MTDTPSETASPGRPLRRPTGEVQMNIGMLLLVLGAIVFLIGLILPDTSFDAEIPARYPNPWKWPVVLGGGALLNLGFLLWAVGKLLYALYFLPGRPVHTEEPGA